MAICKEYHDRVMELEGQKWDTERSCKIKLLEVIKDPTLCFSLHMHLLIRTCTISDQRTDYGRQWSQGEIVRIEHYVLSLLSVDTLREIAILDFSIKPALKKVSKYENKFAKLQKKAAEFNIRNQLKTVKKKEFSMDDADGVSWAIKELIAKLLKRIGFFSIFAERGRRWAHSLSGTGTCFQCSRSHYIKHYLLYTLVNCSCHWQKGRYDGSDFFRG